MRNQPVTQFWKNALQSLPVGVRARYAADFAAAERWELRLGSLIEAWSFAKHAISRAFPAPRSAH